MKLQVMSPVGHSKVDNLKKPAAVILVIITFMYYLL